MLSPKQGYLILPLLFNWASAIDKKKEIKGTQIRKEIKSYLYTEDVNVYTGNLKESTTTKKLE